MRLSTLLILSTTTAAVVAGGWFSWRSWGRPTPIRYETAAVDRGRIVAKATATGTLSAVVTVQVGSQVSGRIAELLADFNSTVKKGQVLARIDAQLFEAALEQAQASLAVAEGNLAKAKVIADESARQARRLAKLVAEHIANQSDVEAAQATAEADRAAVAVATGSRAQALASVKQATINLGYTTIASPVDGMVISRSVDVGQTVAASLQAPTLFTIAEDLRKMQVDTSVAESDVGRLKEGMAVTFTVDAWPGERFPGAVRQVRYASQTVQNVVTYDAVVDVDNPALKLRPGMTANVAFVYAEKDAALRLPNAALRYRPPQSAAAITAVTPDKAGPTGGSPPAGGQSRAEGGRGDSGRADGGRAGGGGAPGVRGPRPTDRRVVWALRDAQPVKVPVRIGITDGSFSEILEGELTEGEALIVDAIGAPKPASTQAGPPGPMGGRRMF